MESFTREEMEKALRPIASLISKSEKAQTKLSPGSWQHTMLEGNLKALAMAYALMNREAGDANKFAPEDLREAIIALHQMIGRSEKAQVKFAEGTSHYSLQRNRIKALRIAEALLENVLIEKADV